MLGRVRRTTRADVGLALALAGTSYLVWALAMGSTRHLVNELSHVAHASSIRLPTVTRWLSNAFIQAAPVWDLVGVLWLLVSLVLIVGSSRQRWITSWPWLCSICQSMAATLVAVWAAVAGIAPFVAGASTPEPLPYPTIGWTSLSVALAVALLIWVTTLVWLLYERARLGRGPSLRDSLRTHVTG